MPTWDEIGKGRTVRITYRGTSCEHTIYPSTTTLLIGAGEDAITIEFLSVAEFRSALQGGAPA